MERLRLAAVGSNTLVAHEVQGIIESVFGDAVIVAPVLTQELTDHSIAELFLCGPTQVDRLLRVIPAEKIIALNMMPTAQFWVKVARIPVGSQVIIFNNGSRFIQMLMDSCSALGIDGLEFIPVAYEEMSEDEVAGILKQARFIIGVDYLVGPQVLLAEKYAELLKTDVVVIGSKRMASVQSTCNLIQRVAIHFHSEISQKLAMLTRGGAFSNNDIISDENDAKLAAELGPLIKESDSAVSTIRKALQRTIVSQISPGVNMPELSTSSTNELERFLGTHHSILQIEKSLKEICSISDELLSLKKQILPLEV